MGFLAIFNHAQQHYDRSNIIETKKLTMQPDQFDKFFSGELSRKKLATMLYN